MPLHTSSGSDCPSEKPRIALKDLNFGRLQFEKTNEHSSGSVTKKVVHRNWKSENILQLPHGNVDFSVTVREKTINSVIDQLDTDFSLSQNGTELLSGYAHIFCSPIASGARDIDGTRIASAQTYIHKEPVAYTPAYATVLQGSSMVVYQKLLDFLTNFSRGRNMRFVHHAEYSPPDVEGKGVISLEDWERAFGPVLDENGYVKERDGNWVKMYEPKSTEE